MVHDRVGNAKQQSQSNKQRKKNTDRVRRSRLSMFDSVRSSSSAIFSQSSSGEGGDDTGRWNSFLNQSFCFIYALPFAVDRKGRS